MAKSAPNEPEETAASPAAKPPRFRLWCVVRIVDYRLQALANESDDPDNMSYEWTDLGGDSVLSADRESMFQLARQHQGLLMAANGLPGPGRVAKFSANVKALEGTAPDAPAKPF